MTNQLGLLGLAMAAVLPIHASLITGDFETGDLSGWTTFTTTVPLGMLGSSPLPDVIPFDTTVTPYPPTAQGSKWAAAPVVGLRKSQVLEAS